MGISRITPYVVVLNVSSSHPLGGPEERRLRSGVVVEHHFNPRGEHAEFAASAWIAHDREYGGGAGLPDSVRM